MSIKSTLLLAFLLFVLFQGCKKISNCETDLRPSLNVANDIVWSQSEFRYVFNMILRAQGDSLLHSNYLTVIDSALVAYKPFEHKYSFRFTGLISCDSIRRCGRMEVVSDRDLLETGSVTTVTFIDFDDESGTFVSCVDSIVFRGPDAFNNLIFTSRVTNATLLKYLCDTVSSNLHISSETELKIPSTAFANINTAEYTVKGSCSGFSSRGYSFEAQFDTLESRVNCPWFSGGMIYFSVVGIPIPTGQITFISSDGCSNRINYDFEGNEYRWYLNPGHLRN
jgi:hypothetical protein